MEKLKGNGKHIIKKEKFVLCKKNNEFFLGINDKNRKYKKSRIYKIAGYNIDYFSQSSYS